ncbi:hypothetical protein [Paenibacillus flagellatus]|uniref:Uncharacterized protein n=1 Tax=Paenibacillus flagellatus TaxID=2211139 RepID=A0A2V5K556_9BACL|nr:hypothetical protein [Paenibacillus flagellatus]PYI53054.1 hypothetical protein DLM86_18825 [Paenibacillus flagellatus]
MGKNVSTKRQPVYPGPEALRRTAGAVIPLYRKIASDGAYARRWTRAVRTLDLGRMIRLFEETRPIGRLGLATNGIGFFVTVPFPAPLQEYTNGTSIPPGTTQFRFGTKANRTIAAAVLPLYRTIRDCPPFASALSAAIRRRNLRRVRELVHSRVRSRFLRDVTLIESGFAMEFRIPGDKFPYLNEFFREFNG